MQPRNQRTITTSIPIDYASRSMCDEVPQCRGLVSLMTAVMGATLVTASLLWAVSGRIYEMRSGYEIHQLQRQSASLRRERSELRVQVAMLQRPERLAKIAQERLGLEPTPPERVYALTPTRAPKTDASSFTSTAKGDSHVAQ